MMMVRMQPGQKPRQHTTTRAPDHNPTAGAEQDCLRVLGLKEEDQTTRKPNEGSRKAGSGSKRI